MRFKSVVLSASVSLLCLVPLSGFATTLTFVSGTSSGGESIYPYEMSINGSRIDVPMSCLNDDRNVFAGETWNVNVNNLATLSGSIDGASLVELREDAWLDSLYNTGFDGYSNKEIQDAIWHIQDPSNHGNSNGNSDFDSNSATLAGLAVNAQAGLTSAFLAQFTLYTPVSTYSDSYYDGWHYDGEPQEFLQYTPATPPATPEPSSLLLLGTGLAGAAGMMRRRMANAFSAS